MEQQLKNEKILIIESNVSFGAQIVDLLKKDGYENVFLVKNGIEGIKNIYDILPHLILLDVTLMGGSSYDVLAKKQNEPLLAKIPVFLISTQGVPIVMKDVPEGSVKEFITSMYADPKMIVEKIDNHFGHQFALDGKGRGDANQVKAKLLWVEDDKLIGKILSKKFLDSDFDLFHANNGTEALEYLKTSKPDVIVVDILLPGMGGFDVIKNIRDYDGYKDIPIMVLSNLSKASDMDRARILGAKKFLVKATVSLDQIVLEVKSMYKS